MNYLIVAETHKEYVEYVKENNLSSSTAIYANQPSVFYKYVDQPFKMILLGGWFMDDDLLRTVRLFYRKQSSEVVVEPEPIINLESSEESKVIKPMRSRLKVEET